MTKGIRRIHMHWTAGADGVNDVEHGSYNEIIGRDGTVTPGEFPWEAQVPPLRPGQYAAHTLQANSRAFGIAVDAMAGAKERPLVWGSAPMTEVQIAKLVERVAHWCEFFDITPARDTVLTHAEVERTLGIKQRNKWDIMVLPGMTRVEDPVVIGDELRRRVVAAMGDKLAPVVHWKPAPTRLPPKVQVSVTKPKKPDTLAEKLDAVWMSIASLFKGR